ncbi:MAG: hypothetical protein U0Q18_29740 [Bryobacteraceae bacterium]
MDLAAHQRDLYRLVTMGQRDLTASDPYIQAVTRSPHLELLRGVILEWREFDVERSCVLTAALLQRLGIFKDAVRDFAGVRPISPFIEKLGDAFLEYASDHSNRLVSCTAQFERAILSVKRGSACEYVVDWPCDPRPVLNGEARPDSTSHPCYRTLISAQIAGYIRLTQIG